MISSSVPQKEELPLVHCLVLVAGQDTSDVPPEFPARAKTVHQTKHPNGSVAIVKLFAMVGCNGTTEGEREHEDQWRSLGCLDWKPGFICLDGEEHTLSITLQSFGEKRVHKPQKRTNYRERG